MWRVTGFSPTAKVDGVLIRIREGVVIVARFELFTCRGLSQKVRFPSFVGSRSDMYIGRHAEGERPWLLGVCCDDGAENDGKQVLELKLGWVELGAVTEIVQTV